MSRSVAAGVAFFRRFSIRSFPLISGFAIHLGFFPIISGYSGSCRLPETPQCRKGAWVIYFRSDRPKWSAPPDRELSMRIHLLPVVLHFNNGGAGIARAWLRANEWFAYGEDENAVFSVFLYCGLCHDVWACSAFVYISLMHYRHPAAFAFFSNWETRTASVLSGNLLGSS